MEHFIKRPIHNIPYTAPRPDAARLSAQRTGEHKTTDLLQFHLQLDGWPQPGQKKLDDGGWCLNLNLYLSVSAEMYDKQDWEWPRPGHSGLLS